MGDVWGHSFLLKKRELLNQSKIWLNCTKFFALQKSNIAVSVKWQNNTKSNRLNAAIFRQQSLGWNKNRNYFFTIDYGIYIRAQPSLSYDTENVYTMTISCDDAKDTVTSTFRVYILRNSAPVFTNLQGMISTCILPATGIKKRSLINLKNAYHTKTDNCW